MNTGYKDINGRDIFVGNVLINPMLYDLWKVEFKNNKYYACLIPSSGVIKHNNNMYPEYEEYLEDVCDCFCVYEPTCMGYKGNISYDSIDHYYHGKIDNTNDLVTFNGDDIQELVKEFKISVEEYISFKKDIETNN